ncbi:MAG: hypothetical protein WC735_01280 [Candidatus Paceibacterota bacterium]|jgi:hypothetical protein
MRKIQSLIVAVALACFTALTSANAAMSVQAFFSPGVPTDSTNNLSSQQNKMAFLDAGNLVGGAYETNPVAMNLPKVLKIGDVLRFRPGFPGWLAVPTSSGPDAYGARLFCMVKVTSTEANVNPRRVRVRTWTPLNDGVLWSTNWLASETITMSSTLTGRKYGPDGVRGGSDDQPFSSGTSDLNFNELITVGPRIFLDVFNQEDLSLALNYWDGKRPMELHVEVTVYAADMVTVLGRKEIVLTARPYLLIDRGGLNSEIRYVRMESERAKNYQLMSSLWPGGGYSDVPAGGLLHDGSVYTNTNLADRQFFGVRETSVSAAGLRSATSASKPSSGVESGNE